MADWIDLRSDTVTTPTPEMRRAMAEAAVGDDVYGEDPTVNRLQETAARLLGKEAALLVPSGTMGNQIAVKVHTQPGQEVITESRSHVYNYEMSAIGAISGCLVRSATAPRGHLTWKEIEPLIAPPVYYRASTGLVVFENTHNFAGGTAATAAELAAAAKPLRELEIPVHLDGARIFNAAIALDTTPAELAAPCDSVMFCLSKGLSAPVGSLLLGTQDFIDRARRVRKMLGGGMRQAGVLAAAGLIALEQMPKRLHKDHQNARLLAEGLLHLDGFEVDLESVQTNIVVARVLHLKAAELLKSLKNWGVLAGAASLDTVRFVTHKDVSRQEIESVLGVLQQLAG